jgi:hypothetical protein
VFRGAVPVPAEAGNSAVKLTFSFDAWKEGKVAPSTVSLPIVESKEEKDGKSK